MIDKRLQEIMEQQQQEHDFYTHYIKPILVDLEEGTHARDAREKIEELVLGTAFETILDELNELIYHQQQSPRALAEAFQVQFNALLRRNDDQRQETVDSLIKTHPDLQLKPRSLLYVSLIYSYGHTPESLKSAYFYAEKAHKNNIDPAFHPTIRMQLARSYDQWQLRKTPPAPQKYGTIYPEYDNALKGWKKNSLTPPFKGYVYQRKQLNAARQQLGIHALEEQEKVLRHLPKLSPYKMTALTRQNDELKNKMDISKKKPTAIVCGNCRKTGHITGACLEPRRR